MHSSCFHATDFNFIYSRCLKATDKISFYIHPALASLFIAFQRFLMWIPSAQDGCSLSVAHFPLVKNTNGKQNNSFSRGQKR